jgi:GrpB-like predicted nucleotidyltransferase (UPF0157 family)
MRKIELVEYRESWPIDYLKEAEILKKILADNFIESFHIGSTAIHGLKSKPVIDILIEVKSLCRIDDKAIDLESVGYELKGEYGIKGRRFLQKGNNTRTHHIHIFESGDSEIERHRLFVEYLNANPNKALDYQKLKEKLCFRFREDPESYTLGKNDFIRSIESEMYSWKSCEQTC